MAIADINIDEISEIEDLGNKVKQYGEDRKILNNYKIEK